MRLRNAAGVLGLCAIAFVLGVFWLQTKAFPYTYMSEMDSLVFMKKRVVGSAPVLPNIAESEFSGLKLESIPLDEKFPVKHNGGGIDAFGNNVIIVGKDGGLFLYHSAGADKSVKQLAIITAKNNIDGFMSYVHSKGLDDAQARDYFRYQDILLRNDGASRSLLLTHHHWEPEKECFTVRVSQLTLQDGEELESVSKSADDWTTLYDSKPCLQFKKQGFYFAGHFSGGKMALLDHDTMLLTVGFLGFDGVDSDRFYSQGTDGDYGKILKIDLKSGRATDFAIGLRNEEGLTIDRDGNIWSTEHGPQGGDELNLIEEGANYGWPYVTYGTQYGTTNWPLSKTQGRHDGYKQPVYAWVPSIGISSIMQVHGFLPEWDGDLLVASLNRQTLFRLRYEEKRVIVAEPIRIGSRIRDLNQLENGHIVMWLDDTSIVEMSPVKINAPDIESMTRELPEAVRDQAINTIQSCRQCHSASPGGDSQNAPNLWGVYGRPIAGTSFGAYSPALRSKGGTWSDATLDTFLAGSDRFAPGTTMTYPGISSPDIRKALIEYLKALK